MFLGPLVVGLAGGLVIGDALPTANACSCVRDEYWGVESVEVKGEDLPWPHGGLLYVESLSVYHGDIRIDIPYEP